VEFAASGLKKKQVDRFGRSQDLDDAHCLLDRSALLLQVNHKDSLLYSKNTEKRSKPIKYLLFLMFNDRF
jgi:hypothetical protein